MTKSVPTSQTSSDSALSTALADIVHTSGRPVNGRISHRPSTDSGGVATDSTLRTSSSTSSTTRFRVHVKPASDAVGVGVNSGVSDVAPARNPAMSANEERSSGEAVRAAPELGSRRHEDPSFVESHLGVVGNVDVDERPVPQNRGRESVKNSGARSNTWCSNPSMCRNGHTDRHVGLLALEDDLGILERRASSPPADRARIPGSGERARAEVARHVDGVVVDPGEPSLRERPNETALGLRHEALVDQIELTGDARVGSTGRQIDQRPAPIGAARGGPVEHP